MVCIAMAYTVMACIVIAYIIMACMVIAHIVVAYGYLYGTRSRAAVYEWQRHTFWS